MPIACPLDLEGPRVFHTPHECSIVFESCARAMGRGMAIVVLREDYGTWHVVGVED